MCIVLFCNSVNYNYNKGFGGIIMIQNRLKRLGSIFCVIIFIFGGIPCTLFFKETGYIGKDIMKVKAEVSPADSGISLTGKGTEESPYLITNGKELKEVLDAIDGFNRQYNNAYYKMTSDISMAGEKIHDKTQTGGFSGVFDGNGYSISNLNTTALFPNIDDAVIKNLTIKDSNFSEVAIARGSSRDKTEMINCHLDASVTIDRKISSEYETAGGIATIVSSCKDCTSSATCNYNIEMKVSTNSAISVGGVVGEAESVENCSFDGVINIKGKCHVLCVGGIVGIVGYVGWHERDVYRCNNSGNIVVDCEVENGEGRLGGIVGSGDALLCNNSGDVTGTENIDIGGITGGGDVGLCVNQGKISGVKNVGGLAGSTWEIYSSYNTGELQGTENVGGIAGVGNGKIHNSYTCGNIVKNSSGKNIGIAIGDGENFSIEKSFYLKQAGQEGVGTGESISGLTGQTETELKSAATIILLNNIVDDYDGFNQKYQCVYHWKTSEENQGYPIVEVDAVLYHDDEMRQIEIDSPKKVYYANLPLKTKAYVLKSKDVKEADCYEGKYYVDYSSIKTSKAACIGIALEKKDYNVQGFKCTQGNREVFVSNVCTYETAKSEEKWQSKYKKEKTEKIYQCLGSDFLSVFQINENSSKYTSKTSGVKFDYNWDNENRRGIALVETLTQTRWGIKESYSKTGESYKAAKITNKWGSPVRIYDVGYCDFIWRKKGEVRWRKQRELTFATLKEYGAKGDTIQLRFLEECCIEAFKMKDGEWEEDEENCISNAFFGNPINIKIPKLKKKAAPKIKVDVANMTINVKNGMQVSFDQKSWYTIYPYSNKAGHIRSNFSEFSFYGEDDYYGTGYKVNSLSLLDNTIEEYLGKDIYVRALGKNNLPSEIATVHLPEKRCAAPKITIVENNGKFVVQEIAKGENDTVANAEYEYCVSEDIDSINLGEYDMFDSTCKWTTLKPGMEIKKTLNTIYNYKLYGYDEEKMKVITKNLKNISYLGSKEDGFFLDVKLIIRRKPSKKEGIIASHSAYYSYNSSKDQFEFVSETK